MKKVFFLAFSTSIFSSFAQTLVPQSTPVHCISKSTITAYEKSNTMEGVGNFVVEDDVIVGKDVVIAKGAIVETEAFIVGKRCDLKVELLSVTAVDGTKIPLNDCWLFRSYEQRQTKGETAIVAETRKNCTTAKPTTITVSNRF